MAQSYPTDNNGFEAAPISIQDDDKKKKRNDAKPLVVLNTGAGNSGIDEEPVKYATEYFAGNYRNGVQNFNECPILDAIDQRCESVDLMGGGGGRNVFERDVLLPACTLHQFCYLCVSNLMSDVRLVKWGWLLQWTEEYWIESIAEEQSSNETNSTHSLQTIPGHIANILRLSISIR